MKRIWFGLFALLLFGAGSSLRADQTTAAVQQALKDQGFYYGSATGKKDADTTAAIRRYQIRNGLQITGEIDAETLRSLGVGGSAPRATPAPRPTAPATENANEDENESGQSAEIPSQEPANLGPQRTVRGYEGPRPGVPRPEVRGVFEGTPYEMAPPDLQRHVVVGAQALLARLGYYRSGIDGEFGLGTATAVRIFQSRSGLVPDGRLNMETLSALGLLPGQHGRGISPWQQRRVLRRPVYRGQWIPE